MADFIFLNPSVNLLSMAEKVKNSGFTVKLVKNEQFPDIKINNVHLFYNKTYQTFSRKESVAGCDSSFKRLNKGIFSAFNVRSVRNSLLSCSPDLVKGDIVDLAMIRQGCLENQSPVLSPVSSASSFSDIAEDNSDAVIITGYMEFVAGNEKMAMYDTDFDLKESIGRDYFVIMSGGVRVEMCCSGNRLILIGNKKDDLLAVLLGIMPFLKKFEFKRVKELIISRNRSPWIVNSLDKGLIILNDYSYFSASVKMGQGWFDKVGKYLCAGKHR